jgi:hypothetical protein
MHRLERVSVRPREFCRRYRLAADEYGPIGGKWNSVRMIGRCASKIISSKSSRQNHFVHVGVQQFGGSPAIIRAELAQFIDISDTLTIVLILYQYCISPAPEFLCKLSLLYDVAV